MRRAPGYSGMGNRWGQSRWNRRGFNRRGWTEYNIPLAISSESKTEGEKESTSDWEYIGPCVCGRGPHAFYRGPKGEIVHASRVKFERQ